MNAEERDLISRFVARVGGGAQMTAPGQPPAQPLPPIDPEADRFIAENFQQYPEARYRVTQMAVVQEAALAQAQNRIRQLEFQLQQTQQQLQQAQQSGGKSGGLFGSLFGGGNTTQRAAPPPGWGAQPSAPPPNYMPQQQYGYPPGYQPGMFQRGGSGFLGSALTTAAGVAGGMMAANALEGLFSSHHDIGGDAAGGWGAGGETIINNYGNDASAADPFGGAGTDAGGFSNADFGGGDAGGAMGGDFGGGDGGGFDDMF